MSKLADDYEGTMMTTSDRTVNPAGRRAWAGIALVALATLALAAGLPARAHAAPAQANTAVVVKVATRGTFGRILTTVGGRALYKHPAGPCTGSCLSIWPRLLMPRGKTSPLGTAHLSTVLLASGRRQVTYRGQRLYTFVNDSGTSVTGNGVAGFLVAKVTP
jgi:predicted lipoprotein with Yx(FWY)xxD motif